MQFKKINLLMLTDYVNYNAGLKKTRFHSLGFFTFIYFFSLRLDTIWLLIAISVGF